MVSYNVLSQHLYNMHPELYVNARPEDTAWEVRGPRLWAQLIGLRPDVSYSSGHREWEGVRLWLLVLLRFGYDRLYRSYPI